MSNDTQDYQSSHSGQVQSRTIINPLTGHAEVVILDKNRWHFLDDVASETGEITTAQELVEFIFYKYFPDRMGVNPAHLSPSAVLHLFCDHHNRTLENQRLGISNDNVLALQPATTASSQPYLGALPKVFSLFHFIAHPRPFQ